MIEQKLCKNENCGHEKRKQLKVVEIRKKLHKLQSELSKNTGTNSLTNQYQQKVEYMLMWLRLIPINKKTLKGWSMPDMRTISEFKKEDCVEWKE